MKAPFTEALVVFAGLTIGEFGYEWLSGNARWVDQLKVAYWQAFALLAFALVIRVRKL